MLLAPCVPYALAFTIGLLVEHFAQPRLAWSLLVSGIGVVAWFLAGLGRRPALQFGYVCLVLAGLGAAHLHFWLSDEGPEDICRLTDERPRPIQVRGIIEQEPINVQQSSQDDLRTQPAGIRYRSVLRVAYRRDDDGWKPSRGKADLSVLAPMEDIHRGDEVEIVGRLQAFSPPMNPGESDRTTRAFARGIHSQITVVKVAQAVTRLSAGSTWSPGRKLDQLRGLAMRQLERYLPANQVGLSGALLLGEDTALSPDDWARYVRTGVVAVLVVSGQQLTLLAGWMWWLLCLANVPRQKSAVAVAAALLLYSFLTGGEPPILRAAVMSTVFCGSFLVRRPVLDINTFALAWLAVLIVNPTDLFSVGCQFSFLSVAVLLWGIRTWMRREPDALEREIELSKPRWAQFLNRLVKTIRGEYLATLVFCAALAPLVASNYHTFSWQAILIGPPVVFFSSIALAAGFILLLTGAWFPPLAFVAALVLRLNLFLCDGIVSLADKLPGGRIYFADLPPWWIGLFYVGIAIKLFMPRLPAVRYGLLLATGVWLCLGALFLGERPSTEELRCTFLAVGHGGCAVIETPDGRVLLYDIGAIAGPELTRFHIQPFLWSRGIRRIDEIILSHADLDHFNGLPDLLERFSVGRITCTPTFSNKETPGVRMVLERIRERKLETRIVVRGDAFRAGNVEFHVLHPPEQGPPGNENARSLVLLIRHQGHSILLTGDLEGAGRAQVLAEPADPIDVLMAPHHGSPTVNDDRLAQWAKPKVVVSCEGVPRYQLRPNEPYSARGIKFFGTWPHGAITIRSSRFGLLLETFASQQRLVIRRD
ncbi:MAG TPA: DNA internalization-related competence protein ComEC/Rec2 [Gemmataceae bacterium]|nr:DNA internalization-related competence protein ComEC/Rec2 [Gemmataceae bacterium]